MRKRRRPLARLVGLAMVLGLLGAVPAFAASGSGTANDGYCSWGYSYASPVGGDHEARGTNSENGSGCQWLDVDITTWKNFTNQTLSTYCNADGNGITCQTTEWTVTGSANVRLRGMDWEYGTWQTLNKTA